MKRTYLGFLTALAVTAFGGGCTGTATGPDVDAAYPTFSSEGGATGSVNEGGTFDTTEGGTADGEPSTERGGGFIGSGH